MFASRTRYIMCVCTITWCPSDVLRNGIKNRFAVLFSLELKMYQTVFHHAWTKRSRIHKNRRKIFKAINHSFWSVDIPCERGWMREQMFFTLPGTQLRTHRQMSLAGTGSGDVPIIHLVARVMPNVSCTTRTRDLPQRKTGPPIFGAITTTKKTTKSDYWRDTCYDVCSPPPLTSPYRVFSISILLTCCIAFYLI